MVPNWHMQVLADVMQEEAQRLFQGLPKLHDVVVNIPPGTSKSSIATILFHPWVWTNMPEAGIITASHTSELVLDLASKARDVIRSEKYKLLFPNISIREDVEAKGRYRNSLGGDRLSCTVGGKTPTGDHAHFLIGDDLLDPQKMMSEAERLVATNFQRNVLPSRVKDKAKSITFLIMQRLGANDPTDVMLEDAKKEGALSVRHICLPAELTEDVNPPELTEKYLDGLLDPVRMPRQVLATFRSRSQYAYATQFLQKRMVPGGGMFKTEWLSRRCKASPYDATRVRSWDRAATANGGCATAGVLLAMDHDKKVWIEHVIWGQWEPDERNQKILATALRDRDRYGPNNIPTVLIEAERGSTGLESFQHIARMLVGFRVLEVQPTGSKDTRAEPWASYLASGSVQLVEDGTWDIAGYVEEHELFRPDPSTMAKRGRLKDRVDASSQAYSWLAAKAPGRGMFITPFRDSRWKGLKLLVCKEEELSSLELEQPCLLFQFKDPSVGESGASMVFQNGNDPHVFPKLLDSLTLEFLDSTPEQFQESWEITVQPWGKLPVELIMKPEHGKKLWQLITKKRSTPPPEVLVFADQGGQRALSVALSVCDVLGLPRDKALWCKGSEAILDRVFKAPNSHVFQVTKSSRGLVI